MVDHFSIFPDEKESCDRAAAFGITACVAKRPIGQWICVKCRRNKEGVFISISGCVASILKHGKAHIEVVRACLGKLDLIRDLVGMNAKHSLSPERPFLGSRGAGA